MIKKIGIQNFKVFKDFTEFELAPITLLTGPNNSGKSSFTKVLSLLSSNLNKDSGFVNLDFTKGNHQLGEFKNILNWDTKSDKLRFEFDFPMNYFDEDFKIQLVYRSFQENGSLHSFKIFNKKRSLLDIHKIESDQRIGGKGTYVSKGNMQIHWEYKLDVNYVKKAINKYRGKDPNHKNLLLEYRADQEIINSKNVNVLFRLEELLFNCEENYISFFSNYQTSYLKNVFNRLNTNEDYFDLGNISYFISQGLMDIDLYDDILNKNNFQEQINNLSISSVHFSDETEEVFNEIFTSNIHKGLQALNEHFNTISSLSATRGNRDRILLNHSDFEINSLIKEFNRFVSKNNSYFKFLKEALIILGIKGKLKIKRIEAFGTLLYIKQKNRAVLLSDLGYGLSQIIPILLKIIIESEKIFPYQDEISYEKNYRLNFNDLIKIVYPTIIIEEPEANLHPKLQSKLADIFILAYKTFGVHFIVETHSEYLIRKLQFLIAKEEINTKDAIIYYFNDEEYVSEKEKKVKKIKIDQSGGLTDSFGPGFYDEATALQFELMKLNKEQNN